jgi:hypothetical protein
MRKDVTLLSKAGVFLAGVLLAGFFAKRRGSNAPVPVTAADPAQVLELRRAVAELEGRFSRYEFATADRFDGLDAHIQEHSAELAATPSTQQIASAMEQLYRRRCRRSTSDCPRRRIPSRW